MTQISLESRLKTHTVYIFLVRTNSVFSNIISLFTRTKYTHASIGFDSQCSCLYSFARIHTLLPIPAGFVRESTKTGLLSLNPNAPCAVYRVNVTEQAYEDLWAHLQKMYLNKKRYGYHYLGPVFCFFGLPIRVKNKYFCSQFVAELLSRYRIAKLKKPASLYHPRDIAELSELTPIFEGKLSELSADPEKCAPQILLDTRKYS